MLGFPQRLKPLDLGSIDGGAPTPAAKLLGTPAEAPPLHPQGLKPPMFSDILRPD
jgi:hypothetical protein